MANRFPLIFNSGAGQIQELAASDNLDLTSSNLVNAGILFTSSGSATAPSLQIGSGTTYNPGLYSPGTDQVAVATNGTRRLLIDSAGALTLDTGDATIYGVRVGRGGGAISTNTAVGASALSSNTSGANNTAIGNNALRVNTANVNTAVGDSALYSCTTGALNVAIGPFALYSNISGASNIAIGHDALYFNTATSNIAIGTNALKSTTTGGGNIGIGDQVLLSNTTGTLNTVIGGRNTAYDNTTGSNNVVLGDLALRFNTTGSNNTCIGINAGYNLTTGSNNTIIGNVLGTAGLADTVIIGAGAAERLRIDSSGRVGIGTTGPLAKLDVISSTLPQVYFSSSETDGSTKYLSIANRQRNSAAEPEGVSVIAAECSAGDNGVYIGGYLGELNAATVIKMYTANNLTTRSGTERFSINSTGTTTLTSAAATAPFVANIGASEAARIDSSGRLLVGTTTANTKFVFGGTTLTDAEVSVYTTNSSGGNSTSFSFWRNYTIGSSIPFRACHISNINTDDSFSSTNDQALGFFTKSGTAEPTERMRIRSDGASLYHSAANNGISLGITGSSGTSNRLFSGGHSASSIGVYTETFLVWSNGDVQNTNNSYGAISDAKLKENIVDANSQWDDLKALQVRNYNFKEGQTHTQIGLVAQEVELVSPGLVNESPDRDAEGNDLGTVTKSVNYSVLYMKAVKALQEAMERIEQLEARLTAAGIE